jgi:hypothetical protein
LSLWEAEVVKKAAVKKQSHKKLSKTVISEMKIPKTMELVLWQKLLMGLVGIIALAVACVVAQPDEYVVERTVTIKAPVSKIFAQVNNFHNWVNWSPWEKLDPAMKTTFADQELGQGAVCRWVGNDKAGEGSMIITESEKNIHITVRLDFVKPAAMSVQSVFYFTPQDKDTLIRWRMTGKKNFFEKAVQLLNPGKMDKIFGNDLQNGLAGLKAATE